MPITRYVYKPYGELNMELTDVDMDGNGIFYESIYKYNGQEFDYELGVYNYNARNYDQMTGRFMQTDPKFVERAGFDAYDPYSYVSSNPVNFTDPTGECPTLQKPGIMGNYSGSGNCDGPLPNWWMNDFIFLSFVGYGIQSGDYRLAIAYYFWQSSQVRTPLSEVDKASQTHDMEFPGFFDKDLKRSIRADRKWLSKAGWGKFTLDPGYWRSTYEREFDATPKRYGNTLRSYFAYFNTLGTWLADLSVSIIGTILFSTNLFVESVRLNADKFSRYVKSRKLTSNYKKWKL